ncbi:MFS transporter [Pseudaestuariivita sp.]|uniref:MFS transporter n=1 Tax=Pseudaestuariivita sp. TaxID=2211669 RepID=UPI0040596FC1
MKSTLTVLLLWLAGLGAAAQYAKLAIAFDALGASYPAASAPTLGWLVTSIGVLGIVLGLVAGHWVARLGTGPVLLGALVLGAAVSALQMAMPGLGAMFVLRGIEGVSHLALVVAAPTLIAEITSDRWRGAAMTLWSTFFGVAFAGLAWLAPPLIAAFGLPGIFGAHAAWLAVTALLLAPLVPKRRLSEPQAGSVLAAHGAAYTSPAIIAPAAGWLFYTLTFVSLLTVLPTLLPAETRTGVTSAMSLASIAVSLTLVPLLLLRLSAVSVTVLGFAVAAGAAALGFADVPLAWVAVLTFGAMGLVQGATFAAIPQLNARLEARALSSGALAQTGNLGNFLGTPLLLAVLGWGGTGALFGGVILALVAGATAHLALAALRR